MRDPPDVITPEEFAEEVHQRMRVIPWRRGDRLLLFGILFFAVLDLAINVCILWGVHF